MGEAEDSPAGWSATAWRKQLDHRLITGQAADPVGFLEMGALACRCLDKKRKKRPAMTEVRDRKCHSQLWTQYIYSIIFLLYRFRTNFKIK